MLTQEENVMLTQTGPGTPMGALFRRFWLPVMLATELPGPDCDPKRLRVLSEDLIAFKDSSGRVGVVDAYCPHRGAPMFFGRNEEDGLRCVYHGWKFDVEGSCTDLPNAPEGETFKNKVTITAYPAVEKGGAIWVYMGPKDRVPPLPGYRFMDLPDAHRYTWKMHIECNYFQSLEGDLDASHANFLHSTLGDQANNPRIRVRRATQAAIADRMPRYYQVEDTDYGVMNVTTRTGGEGKLRVGMGHWVMPTTTTSGSDRVVSQNNIRVPIDDGNCMFWRIRYNPNEPLTDKELWEAKHGGFLYPPLIPGTFTGVDNMHNDYNIDRVMQRNYNYTGIKSFSTQDTALIEDQRGAIMDRTVERLVSSDESIIRVRRHILKAARDLMEGRELEEPFRPQGWAVRNVQFDVDETASVDDAVAGRLAAAGRA